MGVIIYSFNLNISPKMSYGVLECDIFFLCYRTTCLGFCNKTGALFVPDPVYQFFTNLVLKSWNWG